MPGWGTGSFENEDAQNFLARLGSVGIDELKPMLVHAADGCERVHVPEGAYREGGRGNPEIIRIAITEQQIAAAQMCADRLHGADEALVGRRQEPQFGEQQCRGIQRVTTEGRHE